MENPSTFNALHDQSGKDSGLQKYKAIAFQGAIGANSDLACRAMFPDMETIPCKGFLDTFKAVTSGAADLAMIPVDNTLAGRVADVHSLIPRHDLHIIGEYFLPIRMALMGVKGAQLPDLRHVHSHIHALPQCRKIIDALGLEQHVAADTARAARDVAARGDKTHAAIAPEIAAGLYGLDILQKNVQDTDNNTTRFLVWAREAAIPDSNADIKVMTSLMFRVRNIPAALYKALGGFATNGVNIAKLESYMDEHFQVARFLCDIEGHIDHKNVQLALEELSFFAAETRILGVYPAHPFRLNQDKQSKESQ